MKLFLLYSGVGFILGIYFTLWRLGPSLETCLGG